MFFIKFSAVLWVFRLRWWNNRSTERWWAAVKYKSLSIESLKLILFYSFPFKCLLPWIVADRILWPKVVNANCSHWCCAYKRLISCTIFVYSFYSNCTMVNKIQSCTFWYRQKIYNLINFICHSFDYRAACWYFGRTSWTIFQHIQTVYIFSIQIIQHCLRLWNYFESN